METIVSAAVAFLAGGVLAWLATALFLRRSLAGSLAAAEQRAAAAESRVAATEAFALEQRQQDAHRAEAATAENTRLAGLLSSEREERVRVETHAQETARRLEEEKALLGEAQTRLTDAFKALAGDALSANQAAFLQLAQERLAKLVGQAQGDLGQMAVQTRGDLGKHQEALTGLLAPIAEKLRAFDDHLHILEKLRLESATRLEGQLSGLAGCQEKLQKETANLANALQHPQVRGRWGEVTLRRVVELAGMSEHCDFDEQVTVQDPEGGRQRPDLVVRLPGGQNLVVDSKVALDAYLKAVEAGDEDTRQACLADHARQTRKHMGALASKSYWSKFEPTPEFVVMFTARLPEVLQSSAQHPGLWLIP